MSSLEADGTMPGGSGRTALLLSIASNRNREKRGVGLLRFAKIGGGAELQGDVGADKINHTQLVTAPYR